MPATCPSCHATFTPAVPIAGARCPSCLARDEQVIAGDRFGRPQFRQGPGWVEFRRVPPQPRAARLGALFVVAMALSFGLACALSADAHLHPLVQLGRALLSGVVLGGAIALATVRFLVPLAFPLALRASDGQLELGRRGRTFHVLKRVPAREVARLHAHETPQGHGLLAQLASGRELVLAADLTDPDDAMRLATALREVLQIAANDPLPIGSRELEPGPADPRGELSLSEAARAIRIQFPGLLAARLEADDDGLLITRPLHRAEKLLADDVRALRAEEHIPRAGAKPRYRVVAQLRKGRCVVADDLRSPEAARFLRDALARALRM